MNANNIAIGLLAAIASAAMTASAALSASFALPLALLSPLPLFVAGLMAGPLAAALAGVSAALLMGLGFGGSAGLLFLLNNAIAPVLLTHLALKSRPAADGPLAEGEIRADGLEWYPEGRLLLWAAGLSFLLLTGRQLLADGEAMQEVVRSAMNSLFQAEIQQLDAAGQQSLSDLINALTRLVPGFAAGLMVISVFVNLRLAGAITVASGKPLRPWARFGAMRLPREAGYALAGLSALAMLPGLAGQVAFIGAGALMAAFSLTGLAVVHGLLEGNKARAAILFALYFSIALFYPVLALLFAALALADPYINPRNKKFQTKE